MSRVPTIGPTTRHQIQLSAGTIDYVDTGGPGPAVVLLHGLLMDGTLWDEVAGPLSATQRCIVPTLPLGAHRQAMNEGTDLSFDGTARLALQLLEALDLDAVTLVGNDTGGLIAQLMVAHDQARIARLVLISCEAFDNIPPGLTGATVALLGKLPPRLFGLFMQQMRLKPVRRLPLAFGWLTKRGDRRTAAWVRPVQRDQGIRRDAVRMIRSSMSDVATLRAASHGLAQFAGPALVIWASEDRVMPLDHGRRLADVLPHASLLHIDDSYTLVPLDQPARLTNTLGAFIAATARQEMPRKDT